VSSSFKRKLSATRADPRICGAMSPSTWCATVWSRASGWSH